MLAGGASTRLGRPKQLIVYDGIPLVRKAVLAALDAGSSRVIVVAGACAAEVMTAVSDIPSVQCLVNTRWTDGIASSIVTGVSAAADADDCEAVLLTLADQPMIDAEALGALLHAFAARGQITAAEYAGVIGVPAIFPRSAFPDLLALSGDAGAGKFLRSTDEPVVRVAIPLASVDIDTVDDLASIGLA